MCSRRHLSVTEPLQLQQCQLSYSEGCKTAFSHWALRHCLQLANLAAWQIRQQAAQDLYYSRCLRCSQMMGPSCQHGRRGDNSQMLFEPACVVDAKVAQQLLVSHCLMRVQTAQCDKDPLCTAWPGICLGRRLAGWCRSCLHSNALLTLTAL